MRHIVMLAALTGLLVGGCDNGPEDSGNQPGTPGNQTPSAKVSRVLLVFDAEHPPGPLRKPLIAALARLGKSTGLTVEHDAVTPNDLPGRVLALPDAKSTVVIIADAELADRMPSSLPLPPVARMACLGQARHARATNVHIGLEDAALLCGLVAGHVSTTHRAAVIAGGHAQRVQQSADAFERGCALADTGMQTRKSFLVADEAARPGEAARSAVSVGADVLLPLTPNADAVLAEAGAKPGIHAFAFIEPAGESAGVVLGTVSVDLDAVLAGIVARARDGGAARTRHGLRDGVVTFALTDAARVRMDEAAIEQFEQIEAQLKAGTLDPLATPTTQRSSY